MNQRWKKQLKELYQVPEPQRKTEFLRDFNYPKSTFGEFVMTQAGYVRKYVWILSVLLVGVATLVGEHTAEYAEVFPVLWCISSVMPILALILILETFRSEVYGMAELEQAAKHNLPEVLLVRMGIVAVVDFLLIGATVPFIVRYDGLGVFRSVVYLLVPYLLTCVLTLGIQRWKRGRETIWYSIIASVFICGINLFSQLREGMLYEEKKFVLWVAALFLMGSVVAMQIKAIRKSREEYGWNLYLTE